ncbi:retron Ec48 family effector membrane protein [Pseudoalteromonas xiamenensis]
MIKVNELKTKFWRFSMFPFLLSLIVSIVFYIATFRSNNVGNMDFCLSNTCAQNFASIFASSIKALEIGFSVSLGVATVYGIYIALHSYISNQETAKFSNHLAHYQLFKGFLSTEASNTLRLSPKAINSFKFYNLIFPESREGILTPSESYINFLDQLDAVVKDSNSKVVNLSQGSFKYKPHQQKVKELLATVGIEIEFLPRRDFYELEGDVFKLVGRVNSEFCHYVDMPVLPDRHYI